MTKRVGFDGWGGISVAPFATLLLALAGCPTPAGPNPLAPDPVAMVDLATARATSSARLDASASSDPAGAALTFEWKQIDGPPAIIVGSLSDAVLNVRWESPCDDVHATFEVAVFNGFSSATAQVAVTLEARDFSINAGPDQQVTAGDGVTLEAAYDNPGNRPLQTTWTQIDGPMVSFSVLTNGQQVEFVAPDVAAPSVLTFLATTRDPACAFEATDSVTVAVQPRATSLRAVWSQSSGNTNVDIGWRLPTDVWLDIIRSGYGLSGIESAFLEPALISNGLHWLTLELNGEGATASVKYNVDILDYHFAADQRLQAPAGRGIALDVRDGSAAVVFNGWLNADDAGAGRLTGRYPLEVVGAWRNASQPVAGELVVRNPERNLPESNVQGYALQGVERVILEPGIAPLGGTYRIEQRLHGGANSADVAFDMKLLDFEFSRRERLLADARRVIGVDIHQGVARPIFNGWLSSAEMLGQPAPDRPLHVIAGFQAAGEETAIDIWVKTPDGATLQPSAAGYEKQDFEAVALDAGTPIADGVYRFEFRLNGGGRAATVAYRARMLNWSFDRNVQLLAEQTHTVQVQVTGGVATQIGSTW